MSTRGWDFEQCQPGVVIPDLTLGPITRLDLALYAGASGDHNPLHVDSDAAKAAGMDDVFAHGMLGMAYLGRLLTGWVPQSWMRSFAVRFAAITHVGDVLTARAVIDSVDAQDRTVHLTLTLCDQRGEVKITGTAVCVFP